MSAIFSPSAIHAATCFRCVSSSSCPKDYHALPDLTPPKCKRRIPPVAAVYDRRWIWRGPRPSQPASGPARCCSHCCLRRRPAGGIPLSRGAYAPSRVAVGAPAARFLFSSTIQRLPPSSPVRDGIFVASVRDDIVVESQGKEPRAPSGAASSGTQASGFGWRRFCRPSTANTTWM